MSAVKAAKSRRAAGASPHRDAMIGKIHVGRKTLMMDEDDYRQLVFAESGQTSLAACNDAQLEGIIERLIRLGFKPVPKGGRKGATHPMARKARALWISLHHLGVVDNPDERALEAFAKRQLGCERLAWARQSESGRLIEALKAMAKREGWMQTDLVTQRPLGVLQLQAGLCQSILAKMKAEDFVPADWSLDIAATRLCGIDTGATEEGFRADDYTRLAAALGRKLRVMRGGAA